MDTSSIFIDDLEIPTSSHPEFKKLKRKYKGHSYNGNRVWNSTLVLIDIIKSINIQIQKNSTVLDIGTGSGFKLLKYFNNYDTIGMDLTPTVNWLKSKYPNLTDETLDEFINAMKNMMVFI